MENDFIAKALMATELVEASEFILHLGLLASAPSVEDKKQLLKEVKARDPSFIEFWYQKHPITPDWKFVLRFALWSIHKVRDKHFEIWKEVARTYPYISQLDEILRESGFPEE